MSRTEFDSIGSKEIPKDSYYGVQTLRAFENFEISGRKLNADFIISLAEVKKACAIENCNSNCIEEDIKNAIVEACNEIIDGKLHNDFITDPIQGGAGTSMNMNINEVLANRGSELLGGKKGEYKKVHPNDHVNYGQSTNDIIPTSGKITLNKLLVKAIEALERLYVELENKGKEFDHVIKMGRTQMQDAIPIRLGQEFNAYANVIKRDIIRFKSALELVKSVNLGGTAIGTGLNADINYVKNVVKTLSKITGIELEQNLDLIDGTQNLDSFVMVSGIVKTSAVSLSKIANDLRLMSSGPKTGFGEINLPAKQNGSSIMPGKINPVIPEVVSQIAYNIMGNDVTITFAAESGQLELNHCEPIIFYKLFESLMTFTNGIDTFVENCIKGITANEEKCLSHVENSAGIVTALCNKFGYKKSSEFIKESFEKNKSIREVVVGNNILSNEEYNKIVNPLRMTSPGIPGQE